METFLSETPSSVYHRQHAEYDLRQLVSRRAVMEKFNNMVNDHEANYIILRSLFTPRSPLPSYAIYDTTDDYLKVTDRLLGDSLVAQRCLLRIFYLDSPTTLTLSYRLLISRRVFRSVVLEYRSKPPLNLHTPVSHGQNSTICQSPDSNDIGLGDNYEANAKSQCSCCDLHLSILRSVFSNFKTFFHLLSTGKDFDFQNSDGSHINCFKIFEDLQEIMMKLPKTDDEITGRRSSDRYPKESIDLYEAIVAEMLTFIRQCSSNASQLLPTKNARQTCLELWLLVTGIRGSVMDVLVWAMSCLQTHHTDVVNGIRQEIVRKALSDFMHLNLDHCESDLAFEFPSKLVLQIIQLINNSLEHHSTAIEDVSSHAQSESIRCFFGRYRVLVTEMQSNSSVVSSVTLLDPAVLQFGENVGATGINITAVETSHEVTYFLSSDGRVFFTPVPEASGESVSASHRITELRLEEPRGCRRAPARPRVVQLAANVWDSSCAHLLALTNDGAVYVTGCGEHGALGRGSANSETRLKPVHVLGGGPGAPFVVDISAGGRHSAAVTRDGHLFTWGSNQFGQLGFASRTVYVPMKVENLAPVIQVSCSSTHTVVLCEDASVWTLGCRRPAEAASQLSLEARAVRRRVLLPQPPESGPQVGYRPVRIVAAGDLSLILTDGQHLLVEGLETRVCRIGYGSACALITRLRCGANGPPIGNSREAVMMENFPEVRAVAASPNVIMIVTAGNLVYQIDPQRFTNSRIRELDTSLITNVSVSQTHFVAWSRKDDLEEEEEAGGREALPRVIQRDDSLSRDTMLSPRVLGSPFAALQQLSVYLRDYTCHDGVWISGLNSNNEIGKQVLDQLVRMFSLYLRLLQSSSQTRPKEELNVAKINWLTVLLNLYQDVKLPKDTRDKIHHIVDNDAQHLCPPVEERCPLLYNIINDIRLNRLQDVKGDDDGADSCWWTKLNAGTALSLLLMLRGTATTESVMHMVREYTTRLEDLMEWSLSLCLSLSEWVIQNLRRENYVEPPEPMELFSKFLHLTLKHIFAICIDVDNEARSNRGFRPNRSHFSALLARQIRHLLDASLRVLKSVRAALQSAQSMTISKGKEKVTNVLACLKASPVGQLLFFVMVGFMQAPTVWPKDTKAVAVGLKKLLEEISALLDILPAYVGAEVAERQELNWPLFSRHGENVQLWAVSLSRDGSESTFFWIFELQRLIGFVLGRLLLWCLTEAVPSPAHSCRDEKLHNWCDRVLISNGLSSSFFDESLQSADVSESDNPALKSVLEAFQRMDKSLLCFIDIDNYEKFMAFAVIKQWSSLDEDTPVINFVSNVVLSLILKLTHLQEEMKTFDPFNEEPGNLLKKAFLTVFAVRRAMWKIYADEETARKIRHVDWDVVWTFQGPWQMPPQLNPFAKILQRCILLDRVFAQNPLVGQPNVRPCKEETLSQQRSLRRGPSLELDCESVSPVMRAWKSEECLSSSETSTSDPTPFSLTSAKRLYRRLDFNRRQSEVCSVGQLLIEIVPFLTSEHLVHIPEEERDPLTSLDVQEMCKLITEVLAHSRRAEARLDCFYLFEHLVGGNSNFDEDQEEQECEDAEKEKVNPCLQMNCNDIPWSSRLPHAVSLQIMAGFCGLDPLEEDYTRVPGLLNVEDVSAAKFDQRQELTVRTHCMVDNLLHRLSSTLAYVRENPLRGVVGQHRIETFLLHALSLPYDEAMLEVVINGDLLDLLLQVGASPELLVQHRLRHGDPENLRHGTEMMAWTVVEIVVLSSSKVELAGRPARKLVAFLACHLARLLKEIATDTKWHADFMRVYGELPDFQPMRCDRDTIGETLGRFLSLVNHLAFKSAYCALLANDFWLDSLLFLLLHNSESVGYLTWDLAYPVRCQAAFLLRRMLASEQWMELKALEVEQLVLKVLSTAGQLTMTTDRFWERYLARGRKFLAQTEHLLKREREAGASVNDFADMRDYPPLFDPNRCEGCVLEDGGETVRALRKSPDIVGAIRMSHGLWEIRMEILKTGPEGIGLGFCVSPDLASGRCSVVSFQTRTGNVIYPQVHLRGQHNSCKSGYVTLLLHADDCLFGMYVGRSEPKWSDTRLSGTSWNLSVQLVSEGDSVRLVSQRQLPPWCWSALHPAVPATELPADPFLMADHLLDGLSFLSKIHGSSLHSILSQLLQPTLLGRSDSDERKTQTGAFAFVSGLCNDPAPGFCTNFRLPKRHQEGWETLRGVLLGLYPRTVGLCQPRQGAWQCRVQRCPPLSGATAGPDSGPRLLDGQREALEGGEWAANVLHCEPRTNSRPRSGVLLGNFDASCSFWDAAVGEVSRFSVLVSEPVGIGAHRLKRLRRNALEMTLDEDIRVAQEQDGLGSSDSEFDFDRSRPRKDTPPPRPDPVISYPEFLHGFMLMKSLIRGLGCFVTSKEMRNEEKPDLQGLEAAMSTVATWAMELMPVLRFREYNGLDNIDTAVLVMSQWAFDAQGWGLDDNLLDLWHDATEVLAYPVASSQKSGSRRLTLRRDNSRYLELLLRRHNAGHEGDPDVNAPRWMMDQTSRGRHGFFGPLDAWIERARNVYRSEMSSEASADAAEWSQASNSESRTSEIEDDLDETPVRAEEYRVARLHRRCLDLHCDLLLDPHQTACVTPSTPIPTYNPKRSPKITPIAMSAVSNSSTSSSGPQNSRSESEMRSFHQNAAPGARQSPLCRIGLFRQLTKLRNVPEATPRDVLSRLYSYMRISLAREYMAKLLEEFPHWSGAHQAFIIRAHGLYSPKRLVRLLKLLQWDECAIITRLFDGASPLDRWSEIVQSWTISNFRAANQRTLIPYLIDMRKTIKSELTRLQHRFGPSELSCEAMVLMNGCYRTCDLLMRTALGLLKRHFREVSATHLQPQAADCALCRLYHNLLEWLTRLGLADYAGQRRRSWTLTHVLDLFSLRYRVARVPSLRCIPAADKDEVLTVQPEIVHVSSPIHRLIASLSDNVAVGIDYRGGLHIWQDRRESSRDSPPNIFGGTPPLLLPFVSADAVQDKDDVCLGIGRMACSSDCSVIATASGLHLNVWKIPRAENKPILVTKEARVITALAWADVQTKLDIKAELLLGRADGIVRHFVFNNLGLQTSATVEHLSRQSDCVVTISWPSESSAVAVGFKSGCVLLVRNMRRLNDPRGILFPTQLVDGVATQPLEVAFVAILNERQPGGYLRTNRLLTYGRGASIAGVYNTTDCSSCVLPLVARLSHKAPITVANWLTYPPVRTASLPLIDYQSCPIEPAEPALIGVGCADGTAHIWNELSTSPICELIGGHRDPITCVSRADRLGYLVATGCVKGVLNIWMISDLVGPYIVQTLRGDGAVTGFIACRWSERIVVSWARRCYLLVLESRQLLKFMKSRQRRLSVFYRNVTQLGFVGSSMISGACPGLLHYGTGLLDALDKQYHSDQAVVERGKELRYSSVTCVLMAMVTALRLSPFMDTQLRSFRAWGGYGCSFEDYEEFDWLFRYENTMLLTEALAKRRPPAEKEDLLPPGCEDPTLWSWSFEEDVALVTRYRERPQDWDLAADCQVRLWGCGMRGQLGTSASSAEVPIVCPQLQSVRKVVAGRRITYIMDHSGALHAMGEGMSARENQNALGHIWDPVPVAHLSGLCIVQVVTPIMPLTSDGHAHVLALTSHGDVYVWGDGARGKLGLAHGASIRRPRILESMRGHGTVRLAAGPTSSAAITAEGHLWFWGAREACPYFKHFTTDLPTPQLMSGEEVPLVKDIALRASSGLMVRRTDHVVLAYSSTQQQHPTVIACLQNCGVERVFATERFSAAWAMKPRPGALFTFGKEKFVGRPDKWDQWHPLDLPGEIVDVSINADCGLVLVRQSKLEKTTLFAWGAGSVNPLVPDHLMRKMATMPVQLQEYPLKAGRGMMQVSCGLNHAAVWTTPQENSSTTKWRLRAYGPHALFPLPLMSSPAPYPRKMIAGRQGRAVWARLCLLAHWTNLVESCWSFLPLEEPLIGACSGLPVVGSFCTAFAGGEGHLRRLLTRPIFEPVLARVISMTTTATSSTSSQTMMKLARPRSGVAAPPIFAQMAHEALKMPVSQLRVFPGNVAWRVRLLGEAADDVGGVYEDMMSTAVEELQAVGAKQTLGLLVPTPNDKSLLESEDDDPNDLSIEYILKPIQRCPTNARAYFTALGVFLGLAIRSQKPLGLRLAPLFWRRLAGLVVSNVDLERVDTAYIRSVQSLSAEDAEGEGFTEENFSDLIPIERFLATSIDGATVPVGVGGHLRALNFKSRQDFGQAVLEFRRQEDRFSTDVVLEGLTRLVPMAVLRLFRPDELEMAVCGNPEVTVGDLKSIVKYSGYVEDDEVVQWMWDYLERSGPNQRARFLRFVSGRTRLSANLSHLRKPFLVIRICSMCDQSLPSAQTCFFQLRLPNYSSAEILESRFDYAIQHCGSIDSDNYMLNRPDVQMMPPAPVVVMNEAVELPQVEAAGEADFGWEDLGELGDVDSDSPPNMLMED